MSNYTHHSEGTQFIVIFIFSIALMVTDHYTQLMTQFRSLLITTLTPVEQVAKVPAQLYQYFSQDFATLSQVKAQNTQLKTEILLLKTKQLTFNHLQFEIKKMNKLLSTASRLPQSQYNTYIANITAYQHTPLSQILSIDSGNRQGFLIDLPVINAAGVLGKILLTTLNTSQVLLITDSDSQVPVRIQRTGQRGILSGTGGPQLLLNFIPNTESVITGDMLETSGLGGGYPPGLPVAKITQVAHISDGPYYKITAKAIANPNTSSKVLVVKKYPSGALHER